MTDQGGTGIPVDPGAGVAPAAGAGGPEHLERARSDPQRPRYHFQPPPSWMNDPKPFFWRGAYHVFFQYCPGVPYSATKHWGHAVSTDLVHWRELPVALSPTPGGPDEGGCWTGCVVESGGRFHALYTGIARPAAGGLVQAQCLASSPDLVRWEKHPGNPVIPATLQPEGFGDTFRDPCAWREGDTWYAIVGGNRPEGGDPYRNGVCYLYRSPDLVRWEYLHPLYDGPAARDECPDFFPLGGQHVLLSSRGETAWAAGQLEGLRFAPQGQGTVDGSLYYAAKTLVDGQGRRILFGWIREGRPREADVRAGWSGALALPRVLSVLPDGTLGQEPAPELEALRGRHRRWEGIVLGEGGAEVTLEVPGGHSIEVLARFAPNSAPCFGLAVQGTDEILFERQAQLLAGRPLALSREEALTVRVFVDRSVIEVFAHGRVCKTIRTYHRAGESLDVLRLIARGGGATVESVDVWSI